MRTFERGDVIKVPFPYTDRATRQSRPAVVVSTAQLQDLYGLLWVVMITSAENRGWPDDVPVTNLKLAGLPVPSVIRSAKIATIDASDASKLGRVSAAPGQTGHGQDQTEVGGCVDSTLSAALRAQPFPRRAANLRFLFLRVQDSHRHIATGGVSCYQLYDEQQSRRF